MPTIRELRESQGLSQRELADQALVSVQAISRLENGKLVSKITLMRVCKALGVPASEVQGAQVFENRMRSHLRKK